MIGGRNPNHRNHRKVKPLSDVEIVIEEPIIKKEIIEEPIIEEKVEVILEEDDVTIDYLYSLNKKEQVDLLTEIGYSSSEIKKLKKESDRVDEIFKHVGVN